MPSRSAKSQSFSKQISMTKHTHTHTQCIYVFLIFLYMNLKITYECAFFGVKEKIPSCVFFLFWFLNLSIHCNLLCSNGPANPIKPVQHSRQQYCNYLNWVWVWLDCLQINWKDFILLWLGSNQILLKIYFIVILLTVKYLVTLYQKIEL